MRHIITDEHTESCINKSKELFESDSPFARMGQVCGNNYKDYLFFHLGDFYLWSLRSCKQGYDKPEWFEKVLRNTFKGVKLKERFERSWDIDKRFEIARKQGLIFESEIREINYIYFSATKVYGITSVVSIFDALEKYEDFYKNANEMESYLKEIGKDYLLDDFYYLKRKNTVIMPDKHEIIKTIDEFTKQLKVYANN